MPETFLTQQESKSETYSEIMSKENRVEITFEASGSKPESEKKKRNNIFLRPSRTLL